LKPRSIAWTLEAAIKVARAHRPDLAAAAATLKAAQYGVRAANSGYLPKIDAYIAYGARSSYFDESQRLEGWSGGAVARWSIFDGLETRGRVRSQLAERRAAEVRLGDVNYQIDSQLKELFAGLELSQSAVDSQRTATDLAKRSVAQARRLHQLGQASFEQVLQAEVSSRRAELGFLEAIFNHNSTISQIEYSVGGAAAVQSLEKR
jgi:outer membrane protein